MSTTVIAVYVYAMMIVKSKISKHILHVVTLELENQFNFSKIKFL